MTNQFLTAEELELVSMEEVYAQVKLTYNKKPTDKLKAYVRLCFDIMREKQIALEKKDSSNKHVRIELNKHFDPYFDHLAGNRYYLNEVQRQFLIANVCEQCENDGWDPEEIDEERKKMNSWNNKDLVEQLCGSAWLGFKGQTTEMVR